ncbi:MAG: PliI family lysozyme inhibitor of I-type lysozyme [Pseudomonadota bacterium]
MRPFRTCALVVAASLPLAVAGQETPAAFTTTLPDGSTAVVEEGRGEARSMGSYTVRRYDAAEAGDETTFFRDGVTRRRDGFVERVELADVDGDTQEELVVIIRSAGSGGYLSAEAFSTGASLALVASVADLQAQADPIVALSGATAVSEAPSASPSPPTSESSAAIAEESVSAGAARDEGSDAEPKASSTSAFGYDPSGRKRKHGCPPSKRC